MRALKQDYTVSFMNYGKITIPKGTLTTNQTACGIDKNYNFVSNLDWIKPIGGIKQYGLIHDMTFRGVNVPSEYLEETI